MTDPRATVESCGEFGSAGKVARTPNGRIITGLRLARGGRVLLVETASRVYYWRRNKLRLWRRR